MIYKCLICGKSTMFPTRGYRGTCFRHYNEHCKMVNSGQTTWEKLEKAGRSAPAVEAKIPMYNKRRVE